MDNAAQPQRIVSLDLCADQYVLQLADREHILAVSPLATAAVSYLRNAAEGVPVVRAVAEDVLVLKPDLVVRAYGGGPRAKVLFERAGVPVVSIGWATDLPSVYAVIRQVSAGLGEPERGQALIDTMQTRLQRLAHPAAAATALYLTPSGTTTGPGSLIHEIIVAAGLKNFQRQAGWNPLPLERLVYERPELVATAFFDERANQQDPWTPMRHPVARAALAQQSSVALQGAWTACAGWFLLDAVEALARGATL